MDNFDALVDWADAVARDPARRKRVALGLVAAGLMLFALFHRSIYNSFAGPFPLDVQTLATLEDVPFRNYVSVQHNGTPVDKDELKATGIYRERLQHGNGTIEGAYLWLPLPEGSARRRVLVYFASGTSRDGLTGVLRPADNGRLDLSHSAPLMLDTDDDTTNWALLVALAGAILVGVGLDQLRRALRKPLPY
jgi:hypothetical protein